MIRPSGLRVTPSLKLPFTQYCHYQCCMVPGTQEGGRGGTIHCAILFVGQIQGGEIKKMLRGNHRSD